MARLQLDIEVSDALVARLNATVRAMAERAAKVSASPPTVGEAVSHVLARGLDALDRGDGNRLVAGLTISELAEMLGAEDMKVARARAAEAKAKAEKALDDAGEMLVSVKGMKAVAGTLGPSRLRTDKEIDALAQRLKEILAVATGRHSVAMFAAVLDDLGDPFAINAPTVRGAN